MECSDCRDLISSDLDAELDDAGRVMMQSHLDGCAGCASYRDRAVAFDRSVHVRAAEPVPDLSGAIMARVPGAAAPPVRVREWARFGLVVVALTQLVLALPELVLGANANASVHLEHHLGAWDVALAVGLLVVAWQPERARGLLPMALVLGGILVATSVLDVVSGNTMALTEAPHALELAGVGFLWFLTRRPQPDARPEWRVTAV